jgi:protoporphyrin/coproporphyrin ferrochelatase
MKVQRIMADTQSQRRDNLRTAVVLLQLGGPDSLDAVEPFLYNLFCDPDIIDLPLAFLFRKLLARTISRSRAPKVQEYYRYMGGRSPILRLTNRQAAALERALRGHGKVDVLVAMRYWHPMTEAVVRQLQRDSIERVVLLPLFPQYSRSTTGSSVNEWRRVCARAGYAPEVHLIKDYPDHPAYVAAMVRNIRIALQRVRTEDRGKMHLLFSAHGTPMKLVRSGDPYQSQVIRTCNAIVNAGAFGLPHYLCYQSKVGPQKWLEPSLVSTIDRLAAEGVSHVLVIPLAFVSDHSETLWEINREVKKEALQKGIRYYDMSPALNASPLFIEALADLVGQTLGQGT